MTPSDVIQASDITYSCVANPQSAKEVSFWFTHSRYFRLSLIFGYLQMVFGNCGVLSEMGPSKSYVEMTGIDAETSQDIAEVTIFEDNSGCLSGIHTITLCFENSTLAKILIDNQSWGFIDPFTSPSDRILSLFEIHRSSINFCETPCYNSFSFSNFLS